MSTVAELRIHARLGSRETLISIPLLYLQTKQLANRAKESNMVKTSVASE